MSTLLSDPGPALSGPPVSPGVPRVPESPHPLSVGLWSLAHQHTMTPGPRAIMG